MPSVSKTALVSFSASNMYELVDDISAYPAFLPWCGSTSVLSRSADEVRASIEITHSGLHKTFTTRNLLQPGKMIEIQLLDGPFKSLHGFWRFDGLRVDACKVSLDLHYEFSSKMLGLLVGPVFNQIANSMVDAFCQRAEVVYGAT